MTIGSGMWWTRLLLISLGIFGLALAITGLMDGLPKPAAGGTCGPGTASEAAAIAIFDPGSIGAGQKPPASEHAQFTDWNDFVHDCQTAADDRAAATLPTLVVSAAILVFGLLLGRRSRKRQREKDRMALPAASWSAPPPRPRHPLDPPEIPYAR
jgi:hypothetical protein